MDSEAHLPVILSFFFFLSIISVHSHAWFTMPHPYYYKGKIQRRYSPRFTRLSCTVTAIQLGYGMLNKRALVQNRKINN